MKHLIHGKCARCMRGEGDGTSGKVTIANEGEAARGSESGKVAIVNEGVGARGSHAAVER